MERRDFLKAGCSICLAVSAGWVISSIAACTPLPIYKTSIIDNKVIVPVSQFEQNNLQIIRPSGFEYDLALRKETDGTYTALLMQCTHQDNQLVSTGKGFACNLHGSTFDQEGAVTKGPASQPLKKYTTEINNSNIIIHLST